MILAIFYLFYCLPKKSEAAKHPKELRLTEDNFLCMEISKTHTIKDFLFVFVFVFGHIHVFLQTIHKLSTVTAVYY